MTEATRRRALVVEDERRFVSCCGSISISPASPSTRSPTGAARSITRAHAFDLILLDVMLPGLDGIGVCRAIRAESTNAATPILMITARDGEADTVLGLESGADDYLDQAVRRPRADGPHHRRHPSSRPARRRRGGRRRRRSAPAA